MGVRIIFLDIDGVLNYGGCPDRAPSHCMGIANEKLLLLKQIVDATNAKIVLVSTWKHIWEKHDKIAMDDDAIYMDEKFEECGLSIYDKTYDRGFNRGYGIMEYINRTDDVIDSWIVIDDEVFADYQIYNIFPNLIKTLFDGGIEEYHVKIAIEKLLTS